MKRTHSLISILILIGLCASCATSCGGGTAADTTAAAGGDTAGTAASGGDTVTYTDDQR